MAYDDVGMTEVEKKSHVNDLNKRIKELEADWEKVRCAFLQAVERAEKAEAERDKLRKVLRELCRTVPDTSCFSDEGCDALDAAQEALND